MKVYNCLGEVANEKTEGTDFVDVKQSNLLKLTKWKLKIWPNTATAIIKMILLILSNCHLNFLN